MNVNWRRRYNSWNNYNGKEYSHSCDTMKIQVLLTAWRIVSLLWRICAIITYRHIIAVVTFLLLGMQIRILMELGLCSAAAPKFLSCAASPPKILWLIVRVLIGPYIQGIVHFLKKARNFVVINFRTYLGVDTSGICILVGVALHFKMATQLYWIHNSKWTQRFQHVSCF